MGKEQQKTTWLFMILAEIRKRMGLRNGEFVSFAENHQLFAFLWDQYELLHYYDNDYVVEDTIRYINENGGEVNAIYKTA
jgi:hypothetical protein